MSHRTDILRALANDPAATPGERAAALRALEIHEARALPPAPTPEALGAGEDADALLLFADDLWTLTVDKVVIGTWCGSGTIRQREPRDFDHSLRPEPFDIEAELECPSLACRHFRDFVQRRRAPISVVITTSIGAWMFAPAFCTRLSYTPSMRRRELFSVGLEIWAERESDRFKAASQRALPPGPLALTAGR